MKKLWTFLLGIITAIIGFIAFNKKQERPKTKKELELEAKEAAAKKRLDEINEQLGEIKEKVNKEDMTEEEWKSYWKKQ